MKVICPYSGVPFRTYDSLRTRAAIPHPVFSIPFESLCLLLEDIREQEEQELAKVSENLENQVTGSKDLESLASKSLTDSTIEAIHEKNWRNPVFKLYQTKHLVMLSFMKHAELLINENGYAARPAPKIIDAYFWQACEVFVWAAGLRNPALIERLPKYRVSKQNEDMSNFSDYLDLLDSAKSSIGARYRSITEENKLRAMEQGLAILTKRRTALNREVTSGTNHLAARWALTITRCPKDIYEFWYGILASKPVNIIFSGVHVGDQVQNVTIGDLRELRDWLEDNLIGPRGEDKKTSVPTMDDSEYYFIARQTVLNIVRRHIAVIEQGTTSYKIVNAAMGEQIAAASDDQLEKLALERGLDPKPELIGLSKIDAIRSLAGWRLRTKQALGAMAPPESKQSKGSEYEIL